MLIHDEREILQEREIHARVVMDQLDYPSDLFAEWIAEINALLLPELVHTSVRGDDGRWQHVDRWMLPDHTLNIDAIAPFVPTDLTGVLWIGSEALHWNAVHDVDASHTRAAMIRKRIDVFKVVQVPSCS